MQKFFFASKYWLYLFIKVMITLLSKVTYNVYVHLLAYFMTLSRTDHSLKINYKKIILQSYNYNGRYLLLVKLLSCEEWLRLFLNVAQKLRGYQLIRFA